MKKLELLPLLNFMARAITLFFKRLKINECELGNGY